MKNNNTKPEYGLIEDVVIARDTFSDIPWEEVTEPLPLKDGSIYKEAIYDNSIQYNKIKRYEFKAGSWGNYDFPSK